MQGDSEASSEDDVSRSDHGDSPAPVRKKVHVTAAMKARKG